MGNTCDVGNPGHRSLNYKIYINVYHDQHAKHCAGSTDSTLSQYHQRIYHRSTTNFPGYFLILFYRNSTNMEITCKIPVFVYMPLRSHHERTFASQ